MLPIRNGKHSGLTRFRNRNIVAVGDSITSGTGIVTAPWPQRLAANIGVTLNNKGHDSAGWNHDPGGGNLIARAAAEVDPLITGNPVLSLFAGTNDMVIDSASGAATYGYFLTYLQARISAGWLVENIIVATTLPRTGLSEVTRSDHNTALVAGAGTYGYALVRFDLDSRIGLAGCQTDLTYYQSGAGAGIHPNDTGAQVMADLYRTTMFPQ